MGSQIDTQDAQHATLDKFIDAWKRSSAADMVATWSDECTQRTLPFSLGHGARTPAEVMGTLPVLQKAVNEYQVSPLSPPTSFFPQ